MYKIEEGIRDKSVAAALREALTDNAIISEKEVRAILKSTLDGKAGSRVNDNEYHDLMMILRMSKSITDYSRNSIVEHIVRYYVLRGPYVYSKVKELERKAKVSNKACAGLVQWYTKVGLTKNWRQGIVVKGNGKKIKTGTVVATFVDGFYPNKSHGNHAAFYISQNSKGVLVMDQWKGPSKPTISSRRMMFKARNADGMFIDPSNNGTALSVVMTR
ncbi:MAG: BPSL0067 family protein [Candidatus Thiosymbion ectosymbiont of Robbea hypermnestra]|nr:BPSL0067 family protein [Candidatus Thiosymbion ectosymbiont of Robbea hypermnestra]